MKRTKIDMVDFADQVQLRIDNGAASCVAFVVRGNSMEMITSGHNSNEELVWDLENIFTEIETLL